VDIVKMSADTSAIYNAQRDFKRNHKVATKHIQKQMTIGVNIALNEILDETPRNTGALRQSIQDDKIAPLTWIISTPLVYADPVEIGRRPGSMPPTTPIELWARRKLGLSANEAEGAAYAIARAIAERGTKPAHMFKTGMANARPKLRRLWGEFRTSIPQIMETQ